MPALRYTALAVGAPRTYATEKRNAKVRPTLIMVDNTGLRGTHTGPISLTIMYDANAQFVAGELVDFTINNVTDGSSGVITANTVNTVTVASLAGGADDQWDTNDVYSISRAAPLAPDDRTITIRDSFTPAVTNGVPAPVPAQNIDRLTFTVVVTGCASLRDELKDIEIL
ncbi:unnamed protein product, partial [marine sediment metagenome]